MREKRPENPSGQIGEFPVNRIVHTSHRQTVEHIVFAIVRFPPHICRLVQTMAVTDIFPCRTWKKMQGPAKPRPVDRHQITQPFLSIFNRPQFGFFIPEMPDGTTENPLRPARIQKQVPDPSVQKIPGRTVVVPVPDESVSRSRSGCLTIASIPLRNRIPVSGRPPGQSAFQIGRQTACIGTQCHQFAFQAVRPQMS